MGILKWIFPPAEDFYQLLADQSAKTLEGIQQLAEYMHSGDIETGKRVIAIEEEADELRRIVIDSLDKTFITPFSREDIFQLSGAIDDIIDYGRTTMEEMEIYELKPDEYLCDMVDVLLEATKCLNSAVSHLKKHKTISNEYSVKAKNLENEMETKYRMNLSRLVKNEEFAYVFKMREVYRHLSNLADKIDLAANVIGHIIVKTV